VWTRFVDKGQIRDGEWLRACEAGEFVGTCRHCGDYLIPRRPLRVGSRWDYEAECRSTVRESRVDGRRVVTGCGQTIAAPGGRTAKPKPSRFGRTGGA
jgi:hypothetical protein